MKRRSEELQQTTRISFILILASLGTYLVVGIISLSFHDWKTVWTVCGGSLLLVVPFWLLRSGHFRAGNLTLMIIVLATVTAVATVGQGIHDLAMVGYPIVFIYVGLTSDRAILIVCGALTFLALLWLAFGESLGLFATVPLFRDPLNIFYLSVLTILLVITALAVDLLSSNMRKTIQVAHHEIEERRKAEQALQDTNNLFSQFLLHSPVYAYIKEVSPAHSRVVQASENFVDMVGIPGREMIGKTMEELFPAEFAAKMTADDWAVVSGGKVLQLDEELNDRHYTTIKFPISREGQKFLAGYTIDITERKKAEEALRRSEAKFRAVVENSYDGILLCDADARILYRSPSYSQINGYTDEERIGHTGFETVHPDDVEGVRRYWAKVLEQPATSHKAEYRIRHKDGTWRWIETSGLNLLGNRDLHAVVVASRNITENKKADDALRASEERFRKMFEHHSAVMMVIEPNTGNIVDTNQAAADFYGWPIAKLKQMRVQQINVLPPETVLSELEKAKSSRRTRFEFRHRRADGSVRDVEVFSNKIEIAGEDLLYSVIHDITERKRAEELLREGEERYRLMFESAPLAINITRGTEIIYANPTYLKLFGFSSLLELKHFPPLDLFAPAWRLRITENIQSRAKGLFVPDSYEAVCCRKDGTEFPVLLYLARAVFADGPSRVTFIMDITERKQDEQEKAKLQEQLIQAQKMESVGRLAGGVAHDFNNMLGVILGHTEMALLQVSKEQPLHDNLEEIRKATSRSADLTRQLLAFARRQTVTPRVLDLNETVQGMLNMLQRLIGEDIRLDWRPEGHVWPIRVDPSQIDQMLANMCVNARDAIGGVGTIVIETGHRSFDNAYCAEHPGAVQGEYVLLRVSDDGCGMDNETFSHLFEPFFTTKAIGEGTGLGLATVYGAVKQNGGFIDVQSELGHGATFTIYLPRYEGKAGQEQREAAAVPLRRGKETILVVEDEPAVLNLATMMLEQQGYTILAARTPSEGMRMAREHTEAIHLLMTDVVMPEMDGGQLSQHMKSLYPHIKCLFMSGYTADIISHHGVLNEGVSFIHKPFSMKDLSDKIRETLESE